MGASVQVRSTGATVIVGPTVTLRPFTQSSITNEYLAWLNDKALMRYSRQRLVHHTRESALAYLRTFQGSPSAFWAVHRRGDDLHIGTMTAYLDPVDAVADIGILIGHPRARGQGLGRDTWGVAMDHLFRDTGVRKVTAGTSAPNTPMLRITLHWGMKLEGIRREQEMLGGRPTDTLLFGMLRPEWEACQPRRIATPEERHR